MITNIEPITKAKRQSKRPLILIVDDERVTRVMLRRILERDGYLIEDIDDGREGLRVYEQLQPNLVLLDAPTLPEEQVYG